MIHITDSFIKPGIPGRTQMLIERLCGVQPRSSQGRFWINIKCFLHHIVMRGSGALSSQSILFSFYSCLIYIFHSQLGMLFSVPLEIFIFSRLFSTFTWQIACLVFISGICGCFWFLGTSAALQRGQLPFSRMFFASSQVLSPGSQFQAGNQFFWMDNIFCSLIFLSN